MTTNQANQDNKELEALKDAKIKSERDRERKRERDRQREERDRQ